MISNAHPTRVPCHTNVVVVSRIMHPCQANVPCLIHEMQQVSALVLEVVEADPEQPNSKEWVLLANQLQVVPPLPVDNTGWI